MKIWWRKYFTWHYCLPSPLWWLMIILVQLICTIITFECGSEKEWNILTSKYTFASNISTSNFPTQSTLFGNQWLFHATTWNDTAKMKGFSPHLAKAKMTAFNAAAFITHSSYHCSPNTWWNLPSHNSWKIHFKGKTHLICSTLHIANLLQ